MKNSENKTPTLFMTIFQASEQWKIHQAKIIKLCEDGKIDGAAKLDDKWIIPSDTLKPIIVKSTTLSRKIVGKSKIQHVALEHIENGDNFYTREMVIDDRTFIVSSIFPKQGTTVEEAWAHIVLNRLEKSENIKFSLDERDEILKKLRKKSSAANMTFDKYIEYYRTLFQQYGFSDEDIEILLERKAFDYEEFKL